MSETVYDRVNDFACVKINLASPNDIRSWSFVKMLSSVRYVVSILPYTEYEMK